MKTASEQSKSEGKGVALLVLDRYCFAVLLKLASWRHCIMCFCTVIRNMLTNFGGQKVLKIGGSGAMLSRHVFTTNGTWTTKGQVKRCLVPCGSLLMSICCERSADILVWFHSQEKTFEMCVNWPQCFIGLRWHCPVDRTSETKYYITWTLEKNNTQIYVCKQLLTSLNLKYRP